MLRSAVGMTHVHCIQFVSMNFAKTPSLQEWPVHCAESLDLLPLCKISSRKVKIGIESKCDIGWNHDRYLHVMISADTGTGLYSSRGQVLSDLGRI